jgi:hemerythrin
MSEGRWDVNGAIALAGGVPVSRNSRVLSVFADKQAVAKPVFGLCNGQRGYFFMAIPIWDESFSVKVKSCDEQHQKLFSLIQRLQDSIGTAEESKVVQGVLIELVEYTQTHFKTEEGLLEQTKFPELERHCLQHEAFKAKLTEFKESLENASGTLSFAMVEYLKNWLVRHIKMVDCQYSKHLNANGIH